MFMLLSERYSEMNQFVLESFIHLIFTFWRMFASVLINDESGVFNVCLIKNTHGKKRKIVCLSDEVLKNKTWICPHSSEVIYEKRENLTLFSLPSDFFVMLRFDFILWVITPSMYRNVFVCCLKDFCLRKICNLWRCHSI